MSKTSTASKARYNAKSYDRLAITVKKGMRDRIREYAERNGESINSYINRLISEDMEKH